MQYLKARHVPCTIATSAPADFSRFLSAFTNGAPNGAAPDISSLMELTLNCATAVPRENVRTYNGLTHHELLAWMVREQ